MHGPFLSVGQYTDPHPKVQTERLRPTCVRHRPTGNTSGIAGGSFGPSVSKSEKAASPSRERNTAFFEIFILAARSGSFGSGTYRGPVRLEAGPDLTRITQPVGGRA